MPIDDPVLPVLRLRRCRLKPKHVAPRVRLRHCQTNELLAAQNLWYNLCLHLFRPEVQHGREADDTPGEEAIAIPACAAADKFLGDNELRNAYFSVI